MGREFELKFRATEAMHEAMQSAYGPFRRIAMETTYFDTPDGRLSAQKVTLRLRRENEVTICTLKTPLPQGGRGEWECEAEEIREGLAQLIRYGAPAEIAALTEDGLIAVCGARFVRLATQVPTDDGMAELALDKGVLMGSGKEIPLCEVEVEQKTGSDQATIALAAKIAATYNLQPEENSKFRRASNLAQGE